MAKDYIENVRARSRFILEELRRRREAPYRDDIDRAESLSEATMEGLMVLLEVLS